MTMLEIIAADKPVWKFTREAKRQLGIGRAVRAYKLATKPTIPAELDSAKPQISGIPGSVERIQALAAWYAQGIETSAFSDE